MRKTLLSMALVLAMVVSVLTPTVPVLAEGAEVWEISPAPMEENYYYGDFLYLESRLTDKNGGPVEHVKVLFALLDADGVPVDASMFWGSPTYERWTGENGIVGVTLDFRDAADLPSGDYFLQISAGDTAVRLPFTFHGKVKPYDVTLETPIKPVYHYGEYADLYVRVTGENGEPVRNERVDFAVLDANGKLSEAPFFGGGSSGYNWTDESGIAWRGFLIENEGLVPQGNYILRISAGDITKEFPFSVEIGETPLTVGAYRVATGEDGRVSYGDEMYVWFQIAHLGGGTEGLSVEEDLHWWIVNSEGETVYEEMIGAWPWSNYFCSRVIWLTEAEIAGIRSWKDGMYTIVAECTVNAEVLRNECTFFFTGWDDAWDEYPMTVELDETTVEPDGVIEAKVTVMDGNGIPAREQLVDVYLRYETGEPVQIRYGVEQPFTSSYLSVAGSSILYLWFDTWLFPEGLAAGTYVLVFACDGLTVELPIFFTGIDGVEAVGPRKVPSLSVIPDKDTYGYNELIELTYWFGDAPEEILDAYVKLAYVDIRAFDSSGREYYLGYLENGKVLTDFLRQRGAPEGTYTIVVSTYPDTYGWLAATGSFTIYYTAKAKEPEIESVLGDLDDNGEVDATDYLLLKRYCLSTFTLSDEQKAVADINGDGDINALDYMMLKRAVLGTYKIS